MLKFTGSLAAALLVITLPAHARGLVAEQVIERMVETKTATGEVAVTLTPAERVLPGEKLVYSLNFENQGPDAAEDLVLVVPVPDEVAYIENTATTGIAPVEFSADGGKSFATREAVKVLENGKARSAKADEITHIRWRFKGALQPSAKGSLVFRAVLN